MKWLSSSLTFFNAATFIALLLGIARHGLNRTLATTAVLAALLLGFLAYHMTENIPLRVRKAKPLPPPPEPKSKRAQRRAARAGQTFSVEPLRWKYRSFWFWV